jgi:hypothetical protein
MKRTSARLPGCLKMNNRPSPCRRSA